jgi:CRP-like cAMP-binding protein
MRLKVGQATKPAGTELLPRGRRERSLFTLLAGWAFRYVMLADGTRQIVDFLLPGDLVGIQALYLGGNDFGVRTLTRTTLCVLEAGTVRRELAGNPGLLDALVRNLMKDRRRADLRLAVLGRKRAAERIAYLVLELRDRLNQLGLADGASFELPLRRRHFADALGISGTHVNRSLDELSAEGLIRWTVGEMTILDPEALTALAGYVAMPDQGDRLIL